MAGIALGAVITALMVVFLRLMMFRKGKLLIDSLYMNPAKFPLSYKPMPMVRRLLKSVWLTMYQPAPGVVKALREMNTDLLRRYPQPDCKILVDAIAEFYGVKSEQVFVGVGSDDVLAMIFLTFFNDAKPVIFPDITYSFYDVWAEMLRIPYETKALDEDFLIKKEDYYGENGGVIFPNPNAPTGILMPLSEIEDIIAHNRDVIVVVDEAYIDFGGESALRNKKKR